MITNYKNLEYIGNFNVWLEQDWIDTAYQLQGEPRPAMKPDDKYHFEVYQDSIKAGYDMSQIHFWHFKHSKFPHTIVPPWLTHAEYYWWIVKMYPSQIMPIHKDPDVESIRPVARYWMPWQDYEEGHAFIINGELATNYKRGDVFRYVRQNEIHGSCNIGYSPRLILQVTEFLDS